jgi:hypothetical protein
MSETNSSKQPIRNREMVKRTTSQKVVAIVTLIIFLIMELFALSIALFYFYFPYPHYRLGLILVAPFTIWITVMIFLRVMGRISKKEILENTEL